MTIGNRIRELLYEKGMTQNDLAKKIGVTEVSMSRYISGQRQPKSENVTKLAEALHVSTDYLLGTKESEAAAEYHAIKIIVKKALPGMTSEQKKDLINAILDDLN